ncbi:MAG: mRNA-degrading endonuclease [Candidatus Marinimicrobia bacterium CG_4_10_14_0_2_um_filter_48_9]|nr:MAG: mRNA-degrading endonuclease [Candidatus Marinimicrobia bacterium CG_4_10_14_0_2_um_filter_48_9]
MVGTYVPDQGDLVWLDFSPQRGHEQAGHRPALVLSSQDYNKLTNLLLCCPITSQIKGYPFEVPLPENAIIHGVILADQIKSFDWSKRGIQFIQKSPQSILFSTLEKIHTLI